METKKNRIDYLLEDYGSLFKVGFYGALENVKKYVEDWEKKKEHGYDISKEDFIKGMIDNSFKGFTDALPFPQRTIAKTLLSMSWPNTINFVYSGVESFYETLLELGKNEDGTFKDTEETIINILMKYLGPK